MPIGLSTYAYFWRASSTAARPMTLTGMVQDAAANGVRIFQICDYAPVESLNDGALEDIRSLAASLEIQLELGTRGTLPSHLRSYLRIAKALDVQLLRSMYTSGDDRPTHDESVARLREILPELEAAGVTLALETYEQVSSGELVALVAEIDSKNIGICLDPANTVANLELPDDVTERCLPWIKNWHVKDFEFSRADGWVGFSLVGTALGEGRLRYDEMRSAIEPERRGINQIIEFWLPWQGDTKTTVRLEAEWTTTTLHYLRSRNHD